MIKQKKTTKKTISMLFSGRGKVAKAFAGKHVLVVKDKIVPMKDNYEQFWQDMKQLEKKYGETPTATFVPRHDITYILMLWK